jgi:hypothetical protein
MQLAMEGMMKKYSVLGLVLLSSVAWAAPMNGSAHANQNSCIGRVISDEASSGGGGLVGDSFSQWRGSSAIIIAMFRGEFC